MAELTAACGETAHLTILDGPEVIFIEQVLGNGTIRMEVKVGSRMDAHVTAAGKALLAWRPDSYIEPLLATGLRRFTPNTIVDPVELQRELAEVRHQGWASEVEEHELGAACVAAPIAEDSGPPVASLSVSGPTSRLQPSELPALGELIRSAAASVSDSLSGSG
jgi:IclR family acetate operon transcriptional repressor